MSIRDTLYKCLEQEIEKTYTKTGENNYFDYGYISDTNKKYSEILLFSIKKEEPPVFGINLYIDGFGNNETDSSSTNIAEINFSLALTLSNNDYYKITKGILTNDVKIVRVEKTIEEKDENDQVINSYDVDYYTLRIFLNENEDSNYNHFKCTIRKEILYGYEYFSNLTSSFASIDNNSTDTGIAVASIIKVAAESKNDQFGYVNGNAYDESTRQVNSISGIILKKDPIPAMPKISNFDTIQGKTIRTNSITGYGYNYNLADTTQGFQNSITYYEQNQNGEFTETEDLDAVSNKNYYTRSLLNDVNISSNNNLIEIANDININRNTDSNKIHVFNSENKERINIDTDILSKNVKSVNTTAIDEVSTTVTKVDNNISKTSSIILTPSTTTISSNDQTIFSSEKNQICGSIQTIIADSLIDNNVTSNIEVKPNQILLATRNNNSNKASLLLKNNFVDSTFDSAELDIDVANTNLNGSLNIQDHTKTLTITKNTINTNNDLSVSANDFSVLAPKITFANSNVFNNIIIGGSDGPNTIQLIGQDQTSDTNKSSIILTDTILMKYNDYNILQVSNSGLLINTILPLTAGSPVTINNLNVENVSSSGSIIGQRISSSTSNGQLYLNNNNVYVDSDGNIHIADKTINNLSIGDVKNLSDSVIGQKISSSTDSGKVYLNSDEVFVDKDSNIYSKNIINSGSINSNTINNLSIGDVKNPSNSVVGQKISSSTSSNLYLNGDHVYVDKYGYAHVDKINDLSISNVVNGETVLGQKIYSSTNSGKLYLNSENAYIDTNGVISAKKIHLTEATEADILTDKIVGIANDKNEIITSINNIHISAIDTCRSKLYLPSGTDPGIDPAILFNVNADNNTKNLTLYGNRIYFNTPETYIDSNGVLHTTGIDIEQAGDDVDGKDIYVDTIRGSKNPETVINGIRLENTNSGTLIYVETEDTELVEGKTYYKYESGNYEQYIPQQGSIPPTLYEASHYEYPSGTISNIGHISNSENILINGILIDSNEDTTYTLSQDDYFKENKIYYKYDNDARRYIIYTQSQANSENDFDKPSDGLYEASKKSIKRVDNIRSSEYDDTIDILSYSTMNPSCGTVSVVSNLTIDNISMQTIEISRRRDDFSGITDIYYNSRITTDSISPNKKSSYEYEPISLNKICLEIFEENDNPQVGDICYTFYYDSKHNISGISEITIDEYTNITGKKFFNKKDNAPSPTDYGIVTQVIDTRLYEKTINDTYVLTDMDSWHEVNAGSLYQRYWSDRYELYIGDQIGCNTTVKNNGFGIDVGGYVIDESATEYVTIGSSKFTIIGNSSTNLKIDDIITNKITLHDISDAKDVSFKLNKINGSSPNEYLTYLIDDYKNDKDNLHIDGILISSLFGIQKNINGDKSTKCFTFYEDNLSNGDEDKLPVLASINNNGNIFGILNNIKYISTKSNITDRIRIGDLIIQSDYNTDSAIIEDGSNIRTISISPICLYKITEDSCYDESKTYYKQVTNSLNASNSPLYEDYVIDTDKIQGSPIVDTVYEKIESTENILINNLLITGSGTIKNVKNVKITIDNNIDVSGSISATSASIGGVTLNNNDISATSASIGGVTLNNNDISATSASIGGVSISNSVIDANEFTGYAGGISTIQCSGVSDGVPTGSFVNKKIIFCTTTQYNDITNKENYIFFIVD